MSRYRQVLAVVAVVLFFSGVDLYLFLAEYVTVTPRDWVTLFGMLLTPLVIHLLYRQEMIARQLSRIAIWSLAYMTISVLWYSFAPSDVALQELRDRLLSVCFLSLAGFVLITPESRKAAAVAAIAITLITIVVNGIEMVQPDWFFMQVSTRSSGLYGNANQCGTALVIGMIIGSPLVPRRLRLSFCLLVGVGVAMTFSRSALLGWVMASAITLALDSTKARARDLVIGGVAAAALLLVLLQGAVTLGFVDGFTLDDNQSDRVSFFKTFEAFDAAAQERRDVASKAWGMVAANPVRGNGLASTVQWTERSAAHNMFLYLMADHGVLGAFILPALLMCVFLGRPKAAPVSHWAFCIFTTFYAFFSHNILAERYYLFAIAFFAMGGTVLAQAAVSGRLVRASRSLARPTRDSFPTVVAAQ